MSEKPTRNAELLRKVADYLDAHPKQHEQSTWGQRTTCRTVACIAGWAVILNGADRPRPNEGELAWWFRVTENHGSVQARKLLGLSEREGDELFSSEWRPRNGLTVPQALRKIADGAFVEAVSQ